MLSRHVSLVSRSSFPAVIAAIAIASGGCGSDEKKPPQDAAVDAAPVYEPLNDEQVLEACIRLHACGVQRHPRLADCINSYSKNAVRFGQRRLYDTLYSCANDAKGDCKLIRQCLGFAGKPDKSCNVDYKPKCVGDVAHNCDLLAKWEQKLDCSKGKLKCGVKQVGTTSAAICGGGPCDVDKMKAECRDKKLFLCVGGAIEIEDCVEKNMQCRDSLLGKCEGLGRSCFDFADECRGNTIVKCQNGYVFEFECKKTQKCDQTNAICVSGGDECSTDSFFDKCDGDDLEVCFDGFKKKYSCKKLGFLGCEKNSTGPGDSCKAAPVYAD